MTKYLALFVATSLGIACGGTADNEGPGAGGTAAAGSATGGSATGGQGQAGSVTHQAGATSAGTSSGGSSSGAGGANQGGSATGGVNQGGATQGGANQGGRNQGGSGGAKVDERCPPKKPSGACSNENLACEYSPATECLCYDSERPVAFCQQVDPSCTFQTTAGAGSGGFTAKLAAPKPLYCTCLDGNWSCVATFSGS